MYTTLKQFTFFLLFSLLTSFCFAQTVEVISNNKMISDVIKADYKSLEKLRCMSGENDPCFMIFDGATYQCDCEDSRMVIDRNDDQNLLSDEFRKACNDSLKEHFANKSHRVKSYEIFMFESKLYFYCVYLEAGDEKEYLVVEMD